MKVIVLGAGIIGVSTAWHLLNEGHDVTVVDRQPDAALETSFANGAQISVSFCEPWANAGAPFKVAKWLLRDDSPLLFRPKLDPHQWRWGLSFLTQCNDAAFERNVRQLVLSPRREHSRKPDIVRHEIMRLCAGPYLELFSREDAPGWSTAMSNQAGLLNNGHVETRRMPSTLKEAADAGDAV